MKIKELLLNNPVIWDLSQFILGDNKQKMELYRSVVKKPGKLLDFGCANGNTFMAFKDFEYYGCDIDTVMIKNAREKYRAFKNARFIKKDILKADLGAGKFDYILFGLTGHHMDDKTLIAILNKLAIYLKKGGTIHYFDSIRSPKTDHFISKLLIRFDQGKHIRSFTEYKALKKLITKKLNFRKEKLYQVKNTFLPQPKYIYWMMEKF